MPFAKQTFRGVKNALGYIKPGKFRQHTELRHNVNPLRGVSFKTYFLLGSGHTKPDASGVLFEGEVADGAQDV